MELIVLLFMLQYSAAPGWKLLDSDAFKAGLGDLHSSHIFHI